MIISPSPRRRMWNVSDKSCRENWNIHLMYKTFLFPKISPIIKLCRKMWHSQRGHNSFHLVVCLTTGPKPLPKRALHIVRSRASSFKWEYPLLSLRSSNSFLRLLPCLPVTSIPPCIFPSVTRCRRQFRRKMWPIQFAFRLRISCRIWGHVCICLRLHISCRIWGHNINIIWRMRTACWVTTDFFF